MRPATARREGLLLQAGPVRDEALRNMSAHLTAGGGAISAQHRAHEAALRWLLTQHPVAVVLLDTDGGLLGATPAAARLLGADALGGLAALTGRSPAELVAGAAGQEPGAAGPTGAPARVSLLLDHVGAPCGAVVALDGLTSSLPAPAASAVQSAAAVVAAAPAPVGGDAAVAQIGVGALAGTSAPAGPLDGLDALLVRIARLLGHGSEPVTVVLVHLPAWERIAATHGVAQSERLLTAAGGRLRARLGSPVAAVGSSDLGMVLSAGNEGEACERARETLSSSMVVRTGLVSLAGATISAVTAEPGEEAHHLLDRARRALRRARGEPVAMSPAAAALHQMAEGNRLAPLVGRALDAEAIRIAVQPGQPLSLGAPVWGEVLMRFTDPALAGEPVAEVVAVAQRTGAIYRLGALVLQQAALALREWLTAGAAPDLVSVNLAREQLGRPDLAERFAAIVAAVGLPPSSFCLEIGEATVVAQPEAQAALAALSGRGFRVLIDDFGTAETSQLLSLPFAGVKVTRTLLQRATDDAAARTTLGKVIRTLHDLGVWTVAKGVETAAEATLAVELGLDVGQGYFYAHPQPVAEAGEVFRSHRRRIAS